MSLVPINLIKICAILLVSINQSNFSFAILIGPGSSTPATSTGNELQENSNKKSENPSSQEDKNNATFYYEANEFLQQNNNSKEFTTKRQSYNQSNDTAKPQPASSSMISGRNGRMMDLDALVGDFGASQANKERERQMSGQRQSRYVSSNGVNLGPGKKLHIQGFIPIVGIKDVDQEEESVEGSTSEQQNQLATMAAKQKLRALQSLSSLTGNDLPYSQSSIGHATLGVQRYLYSEPTQADAMMQLLQQQQMIQQQQQQQQQQAELSKNNAASNIMETLKRPIKKITGYSSASSPVQASDPNCLCVPFYMCKNGYIVESSLGKSQIQQLISQHQQQQHQQQQLPPQIEMKSGQLISNPSIQRNLQINQQQFNPSAAAAAAAEAYPQIDERSLDKDIITMSPLLSSSASFVVDQNQTAEILADSIPQNLNQTQLEELANNMAAMNQSSVEGLSSDYSQEILGRMLGLKSSKNTEISQQRQLQQAVGVCGLLRTCCNVPMSLLSVSSSEPAAVIYGSSAKPQQLQQQQQTQMIPMNTMNSLQKYQSLSRSQMQPQLPYGQPTQMGQISRPLPSMTMLPSNVHNIYSNEALAHRTSQLGYQQNKLIQPGMSQFSRANPAMQSLQTFQQPQQVVNRPLGQQFIQHSLASSLQQAQGLPVPRQVGNTLLGSRKILDGRCGIRQSSGINGRVQNLQYHESSADFGEYPAQAAILKRLGGQDSLFVCGGTLISQYWIATAAHCIKKHSQSDLKVRLGEWDVHRDDEFYPYVEKEIKDVIIHPEFVAGNLVNDIALLRLDSPVDATLPHVNPACLPTIDESFTRQHCWVTGWGKDSFGQKGSFQAVLKEVELPVVGQGECEQALRSTRLGPHYRLHSGFICAGGEGGKDACEGDGGSGLYCVQADGTVKVAGLVSWGIGCGQAGVPGVYVNMAHYRPWIENIISIDEDIYSPVSNLISSSSLISERNNANNPESSFNSSRVSTATTTISPTNPAK